MNDLFKILAVIFIILFLFIAAFCTWLMMDNSPSTVPLPTPQEVNYAVKEVI